MRMRRTGQSSKESSGQSHAAIADVEHRECCSPCVSSRRLPPWGSGSASRSTSIMHLVARSDSRDNLGGLARISRSDVGLAGPADKHGGETGGSGERADKEGKNNAKKKQDTSNKS